MNFCTKCQSIYSQPGTCNCYARMSPPIVPPQPTTLPYIGDPPANPVTTWGVAMTPVGGTTVNIGSLRNVPFTYTRERVEWILS